MRNVQIGFDENLLKTLDQIAVSSQLSRSAVVRKALKHWIKEREIKAFEEAWIKKLKENPEDSEDLKAWRHAEQWGEL